MGEIKRLVAGGRDKISTVLVIKKTSTIATPHRYPLEGFLGSVTWVLIIVRDVDGIKQTEYESEENPDYKFPRARI
jgi:hypothetical protein